ncbi:MAG TPA: YHS domain-containing protein [Longimicrobiaceae bacterium]|nr:YHS domain-containing protein [Longimicrobiaceae bacterium]
MRDVEVDPVCGMPVPKEAAAAVVQIGGEEYRLCSAACERKFRASPETYVPPREGRPA